ncbi:RICIN domain-containing protein [Streptomyces sp. NPDC008196]|uniref:RICIN domain-containing protein n=1 Tax=unclassified Streptomyces TaxID=2593676 RepID=UPI0032AFD35E
MRGWPTGCVVRAAVSTARRVLSNETVEGVQSGLCLDVTGGVNTTKLQPYTCHGDTNQQWSRT